VHDGWFGENRFHPFYIEKNEKAGLASVHEDCKEPIEYWCWWRYLSFFPFLSLS